jgi:2-polyprenyl-3-methyl-5-hydroxy-6-metoxy-1,4-benzoquinol methylase
MLKRQLRPELMDAPGLDPIEHQSALRGLRRINRVSGVARRVWNVIRRIARSRGLSEFSVLDVASGGGDLAKELARRSRRSGVRASFAGCDLSPTAVRLANESRNSSDDIDFFVADAVNGPLPQRYDIVISTLFLHHLDEASSVQLLSNLRGAARHAVLIDDLERSHMGHWLAWTGCRVLTRSPVVHYDGPVSVLGAYTVEEARRLAVKSGLVGARIARHWPYRFLMEWERTDGQH